MILLPESVLTKKLLNPKSARLNGGLPLLNLPLIGQAAELTNQDPAVLDLQNGNNEHCGALYVNPIITTWQGETPTGPGSSKKFYVDIAFSDEVITLANAPLQLSTRKVRKECELYNSQSSEDIREYEGDLIIVRGRYLYAWWACDALANNAQLKVNVYIIAP